MLAPQVAPATAKVVTLLTWALKDSAGAGYAAVVDAEGKPESSGPMAKRPRMSELAMTMPSRARPAGVYVCKHQAPRAARLTIH
jgi:hypothetical protein